MFAVGARESLVDRNLPLMERKALLDVGARESLVDRNPWLQVHQSFH